MGSSCGLRARLKAVLKVQGRESDYQDMPPSHVLQPQKIAEATFQDFLRARELLKDDLCIMNKEVPASQNPIHIFTPGTTRAPMAFHKPLSYMY